MLDRKLIEGNVAIEGVDDPVAIRRHLAVVVEVDAVRVGIASGIQPVAAAMLAPVRGPEKLVHIALVVVGRRVGHERLHVRGLRRQAGQVEAEPASQRAPVRLGGRLQPALFQLREHELIDWIANPLPLLDGRGQRPLGRQERPVRLIRRAGGDPTPECLFLCRRQRLVRLGRRHPLLRVVRENTLNQQTVARFARHDGFGFDGFLTHIEPQARLARVLIGPMAGETVFGQDRPDVAIELQLLRFTVGRCADSKKG